MADYEDMDVGPRIRYSTHLLTAWTSRGGAQAIPWSGSAKARTASDATIWRADQVLRAAVITRKLGGGGNRTPRGATTHQIFARVLRTANLRHLEGAAILVEIFQAPTPAEPPVLQTRPADTDPVPVT